MLSHFIDSATTLLRSTSPSPRLDAELLLAFCLGISRESLIARSHDPLPPGTQRQFESLLSRRQNHEPIAYLTGKKEFWDFTFEVTPAVLIPRPETELLIELALKKIATLDSTFNILDLGTGSGCIALSLASELRKQNREFNITAVDISPEALEVAKRNAARLNLQDCVRFIESDWFTDLSTQQFQIIVSNPPYVACDASNLSPELRFEPSTALFSGESGLDSISQILSHGPSFLASNGTMFIEIGSDQSSGAGALLSQFNLSQHKFHKDLAGLTRVLEVGLPFSSPSECV